MDTKCNLTKNLSPLPYHLIVELLTTSYLVSTT